jgi:Aldehyde dehydrogenase family
VDRPELGPKLNFTVSPGWAVSNCVPSWVKVPISEAAAKTVIVPVDAAEGELLALEGELPEPLLEQPATATAASPAAITAKRRIVVPLVQNLASQDQLVSATPAESPRTLRTRPAGLTPCHPSPCPQIVSLCLPRRELYLTAILAWRDGCGHRRPMRWLVLRPSPGRPDPGAPFGGVKASGIGRELGPEAITAYQQFKSIYA